MLRMWGAILVLGAAAGINLPVVCGQVVIRTAVEPAGSYTLVSSDNKLDSQNPNTVYRTGEMGLRHANSSRIVMPVMRFNISSVKGLNLTQATLSFTITWVSRSFTRTFDVWGIRDGVGDCWNSSQLSWNTAKTPLAEGGLGWFTGWTGDGGTGGTYTNYDINPNALQYLGTFTISVSDGIQMTTVTSNPADLNLEPFLTADSNGLITLMLTHPQDSGFWCSIASADTAIDFSPALTFPNTHLPRSVEPFPANGDTITGQYLSQLRWKSWGIDRYEVWFGSSADVNQTNYQSLLTKIAVIDNPGEQVAVSIPERMLPLAVSQTYTWVVDGYVYSGAESGQASQSYELYASTLWRFSVSPKGRQMENLGRGIVAVRASSNQAFISWRLLGTDPDGIGFNLYRKIGSGNPVRVNNQLLTGGTNYLDTGIAFTQPISYFVRPVWNGQEQAPSASFTMPAGIPERPFFLVPIRRTENYSIKFIRVGDLDGDGEYDFVFTKMPLLEQDPILLEAYLRDGTFLWQLDCGPNSINRYNIEPGSSTLDIGHGDNITVYDMKGDGKAEVIVRTANGVKFGDGTVLSHPNNSQQFISILDGMTGQEIARANVPTDIIQHGPMNGHMGIAYLDGIRPSVVWSAKNRRDDGAFEMMVAAWTLNGSSLDMNWKWLRGNGGGPDGHQIRIADVDGDGRDEIIPFGFCLNYDGTLRWTHDDNGIVHGDRFYIGKMDPSRGGLQGYCIQQSNPNGMLWAYYDARDGKVLQAQYDTPRDMGRGSVGDMDPRYPGYEFHTFVESLYNVSGAPASTAMPSSYPNLRHWWDGDLLSENLDGRKFTKWDYVNQWEIRLYTAPWEYGNVVGPNCAGFYGDILGDWREEVVYESFDQNYLAIYTTPIPTSYRIYTLPHNPKYRADMTVRGYPQGHMLDYYLGSGMLTPPRPKIELAGVRWNSADLSENGRIDWEDFAVLSAQWLRNAANLPADIAPAGGDDNVDMQDLKTLAENWMMTKIE